MITFSYSYIVHTFFCSLYFLQTVDFTSTKSTQKPQNFLVKVLFQAGLQIFSSANSSLCSQKSFGSLNPKVNFFFLYMKIDTEFMFYKNCLHYRNAINHCSIQLPGLLPVMRYPGERHTNNNKFSDLQFCLHQFFTSNDGGHLRFVEPMYYRCAS